MSATNLREKPEQFIVVEEDLSLSPVSLSWSDGHRVGIVLPLHLPPLSVQRLPKLGFYKGSWEISRIVDRRIESWIVRFIYFQILSKKNLLIVTFYVI